MQTLGGKLVVSFGVVVSASGLCVIPGQLNPVDARHHGLKKQNRSLEMCCARGELSLERCRKHTATTNTSILKARS